MENIFKTTLKKDIISEIENKKTREVRFPVTKFWASRLADDFDLKEKTFVFKTFDSLELSSPSNKETRSVTYVFEHVKTFVDGDEFVIEFKNNEDISCDDVENKETYKNTIEQTVEIKDVIVEENKEIKESFDFEENDDDSDFEYIFEFITNYDMFNIVKELFEEEGVLDAFYNDECVFATNARQVIVRPNGKVLGFKKSLPLNNDVEVRVEFDMNNRLYFDSTSDFKEFKDEILNMLSEIRKNNFVFVWKRYVGIFMDNDDRIYFGIKYSTRKTFGFENRYNVQ